MVRTKRIDIDNVKRELVGGCFGIRIRPDWSGGDTEPTAGTYPGHYPYSPYPIEIIPFDRAGRAMDSIIATGPEFYPFPEEAKRVALRVATAQPAYKDPWYGSYYVDTCGSPDDWLDSAPVACPAVYVFYREFLDTDGLTARTILAGGYRRSLVTVNVGAGAARNLTVYVYSARGYIDSRVIACAPGITQIALGEFPGSSYTNHLGMLGLYFTVELAAGAGPGTNSVKVALES